MTVDPLEIPTHKGAGLANHTACRERKYINSQFWSACVSRPHFLNFFFFFGGGNWVVSFFYLNTCTRWVMLVEIKKRHFVKKKIS